MSPDTSPAPTTSSTVDSRSNRARDRVRAQLGDPGHLYLGRHGDTGKARRACESKAIRLPSRAVSSPPVALRATRGNDDAADASLLKACAALIRTFASDEPLPKARTETRARVISAAIQLFGQKGYEATSMKDLAAGAGVKAPGLYNHFASKEAVLVEAVEGALEAFFVEVLGPLMEEPIDSWLEQIVKRHTLFQIEHADIASANDLVTGGEHRESQLPELHLTRINGAQMDYVKILRALISRRKERTPAPSVAVAAFAVVAICDRTSMWYRDAGRLSPQQVAAANWALVDSMLASV
jgi:TetR/AcrR family transcriptional regulator, cholesterol catabolism regulator